LDVVDEFKQKYIEEAKEVEGSYLISALNLLSESEIHFKAARNKRLHIELAIIKLAYLNQALHLSLGITDKRKGTEAVKPVAYRIISPLEIKDKKSANSSTILTPEHTTPATKTGQGPKLIIEESKTAGSESTSLGALSKIRQEVVSRKISKETAELKSLEPILLMEVWNQFTAELKKNKNSAAQSFEGAELRILDELRFEILTNNNLEHRFVEQEKRKLSDLLQEKFNNKNISFSVTIREQDSNHLHLEKTWSKRDQFLQIVEMYPLVKELKDKLKLELDY
jgi:DNA polymerase-3 subunit gamma/tau